MGRRYPLGSPRAHLLLNALLHELSIRRKINIKIWPTVFCVQCSLGSSQHLGATTCKKWSSESRCGDYQITSIPEYTFLLALDCIFRQELQCTFRRESSCTGPQEPEGGRSHEIRSKNPRNQIKEFAESDLRWYKSPWEWSYNAPWALVGNSREALDGTPYQSPGRQTLMKNEEKMFQLRLKFYKILARLPWCKRSDNPRCTWSLVPACKVHDVRDIYTLLVQRFQHILYLHVTTEKFWHFLLEAPLQVSWGILVHTESFTWSGENVCWQRLATRQKYQLADLVGHSLTLGDGLLPDKI